MKGSGSNFTTAGSAYIGRAIGGINNIDASANVSGILARDYCTFNFPARSFVAEKLEAACGLALGFVGFFQIVLCFDEARPQAQCLREVLDRQIVVALGAIGLPALVIGISIAGVTENELRSIGNALARKALARRSGSRVTVGLENTASGAIS